ncbi:MAG TPA: hypothetical protein VMS76_04575 [Planctomycetota bacterium]|nr:hypothetical protein [Planctomycetota bacterium]
MSVAATRQVREELLEPVRRSLGWLLALRDPGGRILCPDHGIEHTGKSACAAITACVLARLDGAGEGDGLYAAALEQGRRLVHNLQREGTSPCFTFRPGRHDPFNCSNAVIDGGACSDALAEIVRTFGPRLPAEDRAAFAEASLLHARTYLRYAVLDKGIPAQRAWGLSGLAAAFDLERDPDLERAAMESVGQLEAVQNDDGSYPYHPEVWGGAHPGSADVSAFYQSRVTGFLVFALERLGRDARDPLFAGPLRRGLRFLRALHGPDGIKCGLVEAKPWYWGATYEVASHPFDAYALARGGELYGEAALGDAAVRAFRAWAAHLLPSGEPRSHLSGPGRGRSYQCPLFWAAHACWMARALPDLERALRRAPPGPEKPGAGIDLSVTWFPEAALARLEDGAVVAWVRGARPRYDVHHGSPHGAGLLRVVRKRDGAELVERCRLGGAQEAEWSARAGSPSLARGRTGLGGELRFSLWLARNHRRAGRHLAAAKAPLDVLRRGFLAFAAPRVSSAFHLAPEVRVLDDGLVLHGGLAWRGGDAVPGARIERRYHLDGAGLSVSERVVDAGAARGLEYRVPTAASEVEREAGGRAIDYRLG